MKNTPIILILSLTSILFADIWQLRQPKINPGDPAWTKNYSSDHFAIWYGDTTPIAETAAKKGLDSLEMILDFYVNRKNFAPNLLTISPKYKVNCHVIKNGWAFGGLDSYGAPGMWLAALAVEDKWALAHEFCHSLQGVTGGFTESPYVGWFWECHANWMPHQLWPTEIHCSELYLRMAQLYYGSTRCRYCNWQFLEYLKEIKGFDIVNRLWTESARITDPKHTTEDILSTAMRVLNVNLEQLNDIFADYAARNVHWDYVNGEIYRKAYGSTEERFRRSHFTYLELLDSVNNRYSSPFAFAPQRYGYNHIRLYPDAGVSQISVKFRGVIQKVNNRANYKKIRPLEPDSIRPPGSSWRYSFVAINKGVPRYSAVRKDGDLTFPIQSGDTAVYLVVTATPSVYSKIIWDQLYYTIYRYPYMVELTGAKPQGFQNTTLPAGNKHQNGGGFVAATATVDATAFIGQHAKVLGSAKVLGKARIEGYATIKGSAEVSGSAIVKDYACIAGGKVYGSAIVCEGAKVWAGEIYENAKIDGATNIDDAGTKIYGNARVGGVCWFHGAVNLSGTAQLLGDGEVYALTGNKGVYYGIVGQNSFTSAEEGANRIAPEVEVTAPGPFNWYETGVSNNSFLYRNDRFKLSISKNMLLHISLSGNFTTPITFSMVDISGKLLLQNELTTGSNSISVPGNIRNKMVFWKIQEKQYYNTGKLLITR
jgi:hypothetical protein